MPGGLLQLVSYGIQDKVLTIKPEFTYFKTVYKKYTNFSKTDKYIKFKSKSDFGMENEVYIPKNSDLLENLYIEVLLPSISVKYKNTINEDLLILKDNIFFINDIEYKNNYSQIVKIVNYLSNVNDVRIITTDNGSFLSNNTKIISNLESISKNVYYNENINNLIDNKLDSIIFKKTDIEGEIENTENLIINNFNNIDIKDIRLNIFYNNNFNVIDNYLNFKSNNFRVNTLENILLKLYIKLLKFYTNNNPNLMTFSYLSNKTELSLNSDIDYDYSIYNIDYIEIKYDNFLDGNNNYAYDYNEIFLLKDNIFLNSNIITILSYVKQTNIINNCIKYKLFTNNFNIENDFILSSFINYDNWSSYKNCFILSNKVTKYFEYESIFNNIDNLNIGDILFGFNYKEIYTDNNIIKKFLIGAIGKIEGTNMFLSSSNDIILRTIGVGLFEIQFSFSVADIFVVGDVIKLEKGFIDSISLYNTKYNGFWYINDIDNNKIKIYADSNLFTSNDEVICGSDPDITISKVLNFTDETDFKNVSTDVDCIEFYKLDNPGIIDNVDRIESNDSLNLRFETINDGEFKIQFINLTNTYFEVDDVIEIENIINMDNLWNNKYSGLFKIIENNLTFIVLRSLSSKFKLNELDTIVCNSNLKVRIIKYNIIDRIDIGVNFDFAIKINEINSDSNKINFELFDNKMNLNNIFQSNNIIYNSNYDRSYVSSGVAILNSLNVNLINSDILENYYFIKNTKYNLIKKLSQEEYYNNLITYSTTCLDNQYKLLYNFLQNLFVGFFYISNTFKVDSTTSIVDKFSETYLYSSIFNKFLNNYLIKNSANNSFYSQNSSTCPEYIYNKFVNRIVNYITNSSDSKNVYGSISNFKVNLSSKFTSRFIKGVNSLQDIVNDNDSFDTVNLLDKLNYLNTINPFINVKLNSTRYSNGVTDGSFVQINDLVSIYSDAMKVNLIGKFIIVSFDTTYSENYYKLALSDYDEEINDYNISSIDKLTDNSYIFSDSNPTFYVQINGNTLDLTKITLKVNNTNYLNYSEDSTGNTSYIDENDNTLEIQQNDVLCIYYTTSDNFNLYQSSFLTKLKLDNISGDEYKFIIDSLDDDFIKFQTSTYEGITYIYYAFKEVDSTSDFTKGIKITSIKETPRYFNILSLDRIKSDSTYTNLSIPSIISSQHYHYCNILYNLYLMYLYNEMKTNDNSYFNTIILNRIFLISSKIYKIINENSAYYSDGDPETFVASQKSVLRITYYTDLTRIFNTNTIVNELLNTIPTDSVSYFNGIKTYLNGKTTLDGSTYNLSDNILSKSNSVILDDNLLIDEIVTYFKNLFTQFYTDEYADINDVTSLIGFNNCPNSYKQLFYVGALNNVSEEYINMINHYYYDDFVNYYHKDIGSFFYDHVNDSTTLTSENIRNQIEDKVLIYTNIHELKNAGFYINNLNNKYDSYENNLVNLANNIDLIDNVRNINFSSINLSTSEIKSIIYNNLNLDINDNVNFDNIISNEVLMDETNSLKYLLYDNFIDSNNLYIYLNKYIFTIAINQIVDNFNYFLTNYHVNKDINNDVINEYNYKLLDGLYVPEKYYEKFLEKINYINSLDDINDEVNIYELELNIFNNLKEYYFDSSNNYKSIEIIEKYVNDNNILNDYRLKRGCIVSLIEYNNLNYESNSLIVNKINKNNGIEELHIPFYIGNLFDATKIVSIDFINPILKLELNKIFYNIQLKFGKNERNKNVIKNQYIGFALNGIKLKTFKSDINPLNTSSPNIEYLIDIGSKYYKNYNTHEKTRTVIQIGDEINLYRYNIIESKYFITKIVVSDVITSQYGGMNRVKFITSYNPNISKNIYGFKTNLGYNYGFKFLKIEFENYNFNLYSYINQIDNVNEFDGTTDILNESVYYSGKFMNELDIDAISYLKNTNYLGDNLRHPDGHSKIVGLSYDGYPIYGPYGYVNKNEKSEIILISSSYRLRNDVSENRLNLIKSNDEIPQSFKIGSLVYDYIYENGFGDLDECNGRFCITPEFPYGTYAYFLTFREENQILTPQYPYIIGDHFYGRQDTYVSVYVGIDELNNYRVSNHELVLESNITNIFTIDVISDGTFSIAFNNDINIFENEIIKISNKNNLEKFNNYYKVISLADNKIFLNGSKSVFNTNETIICGGTSDNNIIISSYIDYEKYDFLQNVNTNIDTVDVYKLDSPGIQDNIDYFLSSNIDTFTIINTSEIGKFKLKFNNVDNLVNFFNINDIIQIRLNLDTLNKLDKGYLGYWRINNIFENEITLIGKGVVTKIETIDIANNPSLIINKFNQAKEIVNIKNNNITFDNFNFPFNESENIYFIGEKGKYSYGNIKLDINQYYYVNILNDGLDYIDKQIVYAYKDIPNTLEYVDEYKFFLRRKSKFYEGYYYDFTNKKLSILDLNLFNQVQMKEIINFKDSLMYDINKVKNNINPDLNILNTIFVRLLNIEDFFMVIGSLIPLYFKGIFLDKVIEALDNKSNFVNKIFEVISKNLNSGNKQFKIYYNNNLNIIKDYNFDTSNLYDNVNLQLDVYIEKLNELDNINNNYILYKNKESQILNRVEKPTFAWVKNVGHFLFDEISLYFNDLLIDKQYSDWINIWNELNNYDDKKEILNKMIGNTYDLIELNSNIINEARLIVPLRFWFCRFRGLNIPLIAMKNTDILLKVNISNIENLVRKDDNIDVVILSQLKLNLLMTGIYLDEIERKFFCEKKHEYLIETTQFNGNVNIFENEKNVKLLFKNCIKDIYYFLKSSNNLKSKDRNNYSLNDSDNSGNPILFSKIFVNNINLINNDGIYTNYIVPYEKYKSTPTDGTNIINFCLDNINYQPSGALNFSMYDNIYLKININEEYLLNLNKKVLIFANSYNILRIMGGQSGLAYME